MLDWITQNAVTIAAIAAVVLMIVFAVRQIIKDKKKGACSCGNDCSSCPMCGSCHKK